MESFQVVCYFDSVEDEMINFALLDSDIADFNVDTLLKLTFQHSKKEVYGRRLFQDRNSH